MHDPADLVARSCRPRWCDGEVRFRVWAPRARRVELAIDDSDAAVAAPAAGKFRERRARAVPLRYERDGCYVGSVVGAAAGAR
ncbi:MAG: hypothetical protein KDA41_04615, partial [Planctomycetales bacterium]|nr:hypothetical protein [Planctomycetales bacterium]